MIPFPDRRRAEQGSHFWYMSIQTSSGLLRQFEGHATPDEGMTRLDAFNKIRADLDTQYPDVVGGVVVAFDIQPNRI